MHSCQPRLLMEKRADQVYSGCGPETEPVPRCISILTFIGHYLPGFGAGGPVRSVENMVEALGDEFEFRIVTSDRDLLESVPYSEIVRDSWNRVGKAKVYYASPGRRGALSWARLMQRTSYDVLYLNSLFDPAYTLRPLFASRLVQGPTRPIVIAPRGELSPGALGIKRWKKLPFLALAKTMPIYGDVLWHTSTVDEAGLVRQTFGHAARVAVARNLPAKLLKPPAFTCGTEPPGPLRVVFLSRISRKKNLGYALKVVSRSPSPIRFDIWGTLEDPAYWKECRDLIQAMPQHVEVRYRGPAQHSEVASLLAQYDLFFLPTRGENYGHVIAEALSAGTPVLLSDTTPWRALSSLGIGWDLPLDHGESMFLECIQEAAKMPTSERMALRRRVYRYASEHLGDPSLIEANRRIFLQAVADQVNRAAPAERRPGRSSRISRRS